VSIYDSLNIGPVWVVGKGWVAPRGWISPEARETMERAQRECEEAAAKRATRDATQDPEEDTTGLVVDPFNGAR